MKSSKSLFSLVLAKITYHKIYSPLACFILYVFTCVDWGLNSKVKSSKMLALFYFIFFILKIRTEVCKVK